MIHAKKSDDSYARYNGIAIQFIRQFTRESERTDLVEMSYEDRSVAAAYWFLETDGRWSKVYGRQLAGAMTQWIEHLGNAELPPNSEYPARVWDDTTWWCCLHRCEWLPPPSERRERAA